MLRKRKRPSLEEQIERYVMIPAKDKKHGKALLHEAITENFFWAVETLLNNGVLPDIEDLKLAEKSQKSQENMVIVEPSIAEFISGHIKRFVFEKYIH